MKLKFSAFIAVLFFASCQKDLSVKDEALSSETLASDALSPLPCHSLFLVTQYPVVPGQVPPFKFTKTLYPDTRVKTISMMSRRFPIYPAYLNHAIELVGQFSYGPNRAYLKGTSKVWEHYKYGDGTTKKLIATRNVNLKFYINAQGYCYRITDLNRSVGKPENEELTILAINFLDNPQLVGSVVVGETPDLPETTFFYPAYDQYGNVTTYNRPYNRWAPYLSYTYDYNLPRGTKNYNYIPSQNWISQEYSLLEVMQWVPQSNHQRKSVSATFYPFATNTYPFNTGQKVVQSQVYKNFKFDSNGNQISVTYGDNVPQTSGWHCQ